MAPDYDNLTLLQKVEVFEFALENTTGQDLYKVLWLKSKNSETWLERRTNYTRSLAVMAMVGYILGLGDRHPSNLMLERNTGKVIHIDFGDCFEVSVLAWIQESRLLDAYQCTTGRDAPRKIPRENPFPLDSHAYKRHGGTTSSSRFLFTY